MISLFTAFLILAATGGPAAAPEARVLAGHVMNTTHDVRAAARFELEFEGETVHGFLVVEPPLKAGRWPVEGRRRGAWCEVVCRQEEGTRTVFRGVLNETGYRGTFIFGGGGQLVQYGRFEAAAASR